ncbi:PKD domain-containing protein [Fodinibius sp. Rm-B-1B1-1]|uniref:PKD domain-containing protein n=1 Tax=Fodinibius alkaliphilus TaxID=3140241 RepID=UPI00315A2137
MTRTLLGISMVVLLLVSACSDSPSGTDDNGNATNDAPSAVADADNGTINVGEEITLDASGSTDPDGDDLSFEWSLDTPSGSSVQLSDDQAEAPTFTPDVAGDYLATLTVSDGNGESDKDDVTVTAESTIVEIADDITEDETWIPDNHYRVLNKIDVRNGATLTIEPGVTVEFASDAGIHVNADNSVLVSAGTEEEPITLTGENKSKGYWSGIFISSNTVENKITHTTIEYAGSNEAGTYFGAAALTVDRAKVQLADVTITNSGQHGIQTRRDGSEFAMQNMTFAENEGYHAYIHISQIGYFDAATIFDGGYVTAFGGGTTGDMNVSALDGAKYQIENNVDFEHHIVIDEGAEFEFVPDAGIVVRNGAVIEAVGTESNKIVFTGTSKTPGAWRGIFIGSASVDNIMEHVDISYGGSTAMATYFGKTNMVIDNAKITLRNVSFTGSAGYGIQTRRSGSEFSVEDSYFENNTTHDMRIHPTQIDFIDSQTNFNGGDVEVYGGDTESTGSETWSNLNNGTFYFTSTVSIVKDVTVEAGALFEMGTDVVLKVPGGNSPGYIKAIGTSNDPIVFTGRSKAKGAWGGIWISSGSLENEMDHIVIEYGGGKDLDIYMDAGNLGVHSDAYLELSNAAIENSANYGIIVRDSRGAQLNMGSNVTYSHNSNDNLYNY